MQDCHSCDPGSIPGVGASLFFKESFVCLFIVVYGSCGQKVPHQWKYKKCIQILPELDVKG